MMALCSWETGVSSPLLPVVPQARSHGELLALVDSQWSRQNVEAKSFSFQQIRFILGWRSKSKLNDELDTWPKGYW